VADWLIGRLEVKTHHGIDRYADSTTAAIVNRSLLLPSHPTPRPSLLSEIKVRRKMEEIHEEKKVRGIMREQHSQNDA